MTLVKTDHASTRASARPSVAGLGAGLLAALLLSACASTRVADQGTTASPVQSAGSTRPAATPKPAQRRGGAYYKDDGPGDNPPDDLDSLPDAQPRLEPLHRFANRPYSVFGVEYTPLTQLTPFRERGLASWYGRRFHGGKTSSGERYDMYAMTAAHPTLPIPSYARVTNPANGRTVVVRINDRGPFHKGRIMDLSYAAAHRLGYVNSGSAQVEVEQILPDELPMEAMSPAVPPLPGRKGPEQVALLTDNVASMSDVDGGLAGSAPAPTAGKVYLQLGAFSTRENAEGFRSTVARDLAAHAERLELFDDGGRFRLHAGPYASEGEARTAAERIAALLRLKPFVVVR